MGPSLALDLGIISISDQNKYTVVGMTFSAFFLAFIMFPVLPEIIYLVHQNEGVLDDYVFIDRASGIFGVYFALGCIIGVILGDGIVFHVQGKDGNSYATGFR